YTVGSDIAFRQDNYAPRTLQGQQLLAHELAHVLQQCGPANAILPDSDVSVSHARSVGIARQASAPEAGKAPVSPTVANLPWDRYVDQFTECGYDVNYNVVNYFSDILHLKYSDGTELELDINKDFAPMSMTSEAARDSMARARVGQQGRVFPEV